MHPTSVLVAQITLFALMAQQGTHTIMLTHEKINALQLRPHSKIFQI